MLLQFIENRGNMDVIDVLFMVIAYTFIVLVMLPVHELAHALAADLCGDQTARWHGRLTLNPFAHLSLYGTLMIVLFGFGYAKPVPINPRNFRHPRRDTIFVSLMGPASNLLMAILSAGIYKLCTLFVTDVTVLGILSFVLLGVLMSVNVSLAVFNLLPIPPLDGSRLWSSLLPGRWSYTIERYSRQIMIVMFVLLAMGVLSGPIAWLNRLFCSGILRLFGLI